VENFLVSYINGVKDKIQSLKLDFPVIISLERDFFTLSECISNVLITGKSNFDEKKWATGQSCIRKEITSYRIGSLATNSIVNRKFRIFLYICIQVP
jgi:hypothetical protein